MQGIKFTNIYPLLQIPYWKITTKKRSLKVTCPLDKFLSFDTHPKDAIVISDDLRLLIWIPEKLQCRWMKDNAQTFLAIIFSFLLLTMVIETHFYLHFFYFDLLFIAVNTSNLLFMSWTLINLSEQCTCIWYVINFLKVKYNPWKTICLEKVLHGFNLKKPIVIKKNNKLLYVLGRLTTLQHYYGGKQPLRCKNIRVWE